MYPHERSLVKQLAGKPFALIGVNSDRDREKIKEIIVEKKLNWRSFWNGGSTSGPISTKWNVSGWPTVYIVDAKGTIRYKGHGRGIDEVIEKCLSDIMVDVKIKHGDEDDEEDEDEDKDDDKEEDKKDGDKAKDKKKEKDGEDK